MKLPIIPIAAFMTMLTVRAFAQDTLYLNDRLDIISDPIEIEYKAVATEQNKRTTLDIYKLDGTHYMMKTLSRFDKRKHRNEWKNEGRMVMFYESGEDSLVSYYHRDKKVDFDTVFYKSGRVMLVYKEYRGSPGKPTSDYMYGELRQYYENGVLKREQKLNKTGTEIVYGKCFDENGNEKEFTPYYIAATCDMDQFQKIISANLAYPQEALHKRDITRVFVNFVVDKKGRAKSHRVAKFTDYYFDLEALRVVKLASVMMDFKPAIRDGEPVECNITHVITFVPSMDMLSDRDKRHLRTPR